LDALVSLRLRRGYRAGRFCHWLPIESPTGQLGHIILWPQFSVAIIDSRILLLLFVATFHKICHLVEVPSGIQWCSGVRIYIFRIGDGSMVSLSSIGMRVMSPCRTP
jgi:hypothetical protein